MTQQRDWNLQMLLGSLSLPELPAAARGTHFVVVLPSAHKVAASAHAPAPGSCGLHNPNVLWDALTSNAPGGRAARSVLHATRGDVRRCSLLCLWKHCLVWEASPDIIRVRRAGPGLRLTQLIRIFCRNNPGFCWSDWEGSLFNMTQNTWDYSLVNVLLCIYCSLTLTDLIYLSVIPLFINLGITGKVTV